MSGNRSSATGRVSRRAASHGKTRPALESGAGMSPDRVAVTGGGWQPTLPSSPMMSAVLGKVSSLCSVPIAAPKQFPVAAASLPQRASSSRQRGAPRAATSQGASPSKGSTAGSSPGKTPRQVYEAKSAFNPAPRSWGPGANGARVDQTDQRKRPQKNGASSDAPLLSQEGGQQRRIWGPGGAGAVAQRQRPVEEPSPKPREVPTEGAQPRRWVGKQRRVVEDDLDEEDGESTAVLAAIQPRRASFDRRADSEEASARPTILVARLPSVSVTDEDCSDRDAQVVEMDASPRAEEADAEEAQWMQSQRQAMKSQTAIKIIAVTDQADACESSDTKADQADAGEAFDTQAEEWRKRRADASKRRMLATEAVLANHIDPMAGEVEEPSVLTVIPVTEEVGTEEEAGAMLPSAIAAHPVAEEPASGENVSPVTGTVEDKKHRRPLRLLSDHLDQKDEAVTENEHASVPCPDESQCVEQGGEIADGVAGQKLTKAGIEASADSQLQIGDVTKSAAHMLFVFDFDLTIAALHLWGTYKNAPLDSVPVDNSTFVNLEAFGDFVHAARDLGHHVAIATFGRKDVVNKAMIYALGEEHGVAISTPADHGQEDGTSLGSKNVQLEALENQFEVKQCQIRFFDDDIRNVEEAVKIGVTSTHTPEGLTREVLARTGIIPNDDSSNNVKDPTSTDVAAMYVSGNGIVEIETSANGTHPGASKQGKTSWADLAENAADTSVDLSANDEDVDAKVKLFEQKCADERADEHHQHVVVTHRGERLPLGSPKKSQSTS